MQSKPLRLLLGLLLDLHVLQLEQIEVRGGVGVVSEVDESLEQLPILSLLLQQDQYDDVQAQHKFLDVFSRQIDGCHVDLSDCVDVADHSRLFLLKLHPDVDGVGSLIPSQGEG